MIVCIVVVGHQNNPLYIQSFMESDDALKLHHIVHCSLDVIDERVNNPKNSGPMLNDTFLGLLYPTENYQVYGYLTNTKVKFILVTIDLDVKDADVRNVSLLNTLHHVPVVQKRIMTSGDRTGSIAEISTLLVAFLGTFDVRFFRRFHAAYVDAISNPFHVPGKKITSRIFAERVANIGKAFGLSPSS